jgi:hypothetical protein
MTRRRHERQRRSGHPQRLGEVVEDLVDRLRFQRQVEKLHALGQRAVGELLAEIGEQRACRTFIDQRLETYAALDPELVKAIAPSFSGPRSAPAASWISAAARSSSLRPRLAPIRGIGS